MIFIFYLCKFSTRNRKNFLKIYKKDFVFYAANDKFALWGLINYRPTLFCINDGEITTDTDRKRVKGLLEALFPEKSEFEL